EEKISWIQSHYLNNNPEAASIIKQYWNSDTKLQQLHDEFIENTITNFYLPFGVAPNFLINDRIYAIPMAIEESSVVAAASKAAKFWKAHGGFKTQVLGTQKMGHVHFMFHGEHRHLVDFFEKNKQKILESTDKIARNMEKRGGGLTAVELVDKTNIIEGYYQLKCFFETADAMGANFINSCLEALADRLEEVYSTYEAKFPDEKIEVVMSILSNYVPDCVVRAEVSCPVESFDDEPEKAVEFAEKFVQAIAIAKAEPYRAVTHNKGIMNGIDAVVIATGNDFRAVEAGVHAFAARNGQYTSLSDAKIENGQFSFWLEIPLALGTVGGLTKLHPLVKIALELLQYPDAKTLMQIVAAAGLAQNFAAVQSLTTTGIQHGHMKMHLTNILNQEQASPAERNAITEYFKNRSITHSAVIEQLKNMRSS
ncbi:MAG: hydroxymethylglutaryl-CoA reductase, degradative, partial [Flavobacteriaceae bacterium]|nr:hydroxymethylglutaryl-CoA reductase, degradative [Flavobacteriaceae bacterium]